MCSRITFPGFGQSLTLPPWSRRDPSQRFPHAICDFFGASGFTLREKCMLDFINQSTDKPRWQSKIHDAEIVEKWRKEACGTAEDQKYSPSHLSSQCFDYCLREIRDKAEYESTHGVIHVLDLDATVVKKDLEVNDNLLLQLRQAVRLLEDVPDHHKDWHPGSNGLVLDLLHPSLFPLHYGITRVLQNGRVSLDRCVDYIGKGVMCPISVEVDEVAEIRRSTGDDDCILRPWGHFQWLPSQVRLQTDGTATIESYVNNLHPANHPDIYKVLEFAVARAVPLWNECLSWFHPRMRIKPRSPSYKDFEMTAEIKRDILQHVDGPISRFREEGLIIEWFENHPRERQLLQPDPTESFETFENRVRRLGVRRIDLKNNFDHGLQVIFKLATIHLTPEKPQYGGGAWHVEGALNEHICATALFYYDQENVTDSFLGFRQEVDASEMIMIPDQSDFAAMEDMYGVKNEDAALQELGKVLTRSGRMIAFPNVLQHCVMPFGLQDTSRPGHRKILALFLVDPHVPVLSTANVPPQQRDWWAREVCRVGRFAKLPVEIFDRIIEEVNDFPIGLKQALEVRETLMVERGKTAAEYMASAHGGTYSFCEH